MSNKATKAQVIRRVDTIYRLLLTGLDRQQILDHVAKEHDDWGVKTRAIDSYMARAKRLIIEAGDHDREMEFGRVKAQLFDLLRRCVEEGTHRDELAVLKEISELLGIKAPIEVNVNDARRELVQLMVEEMMREAEDATAGAAQAD